MEGWTYQVAVLTEGRCLLASHRLHNTSQGARRLEILWWECPLEHWESLRFGASMNFMKTPEPGLEENAKMTESQIKIVVYFVSELISLGILVLIPICVLLLNSCPPFMVPKPGQPGQWRCITDIKKGRQNQACDADPVHMACPEDVLHQMHPGSFSSVIAASKYLHTFLTMARSGNSWV
jgi:hypothetical protein